MKKITSILLLSIMLLTIFATSALAVVPYSPLKPVVHNNIIRSYISLVPVNPIEFIAESNPQPSP